MYISDFETISCEDLRKAGCWRYSEHHTTEVLCFSFKAEGGNRTYTWSPFIEDDFVDSWLRALAASDEWFVSFGDFERAIWENQMVKRHGFAPIPDERWHDVQAAAAMRQMPRSVDALAKALKLPIDKDKVGSSFTVALSKKYQKAGGDFERLKVALLAAKARNPMNLDWDESLARVIAYCEQDVLVEEAQHKRLGLLPEEERKGWLHNQKVNRRGLPLDLSYIDACQRIVDDASAPLLAEFRELTGGLNPTQGEAFKKWIFTHGIKLGSLDKQTLAEILDGDAEVEEGVALERMDLPPIVERALRIRQAIGSASIKKLAAMRACASSDGYARGCLQWHGTGPGRATGRLLQPTNLPKPVINIDGEAPKLELLVDALRTGDAEYVASVIGPPIQAVISGIRHAIAAPKGKVQISADYAGIQARLVLALAGQHDKTAIMAAGKDIYCDMASEIFKRLITKKDAKERGTGKNAVLGLGFQMAGETFQNKYARKDTLEFCQNVVRVYREEWAPLVPKLWKDLQRAATRAVAEGRAQEHLGIVYEVEGEWLTCTVPSGNKIYYFNPQVTKKLAPWDDDIILTGFSYQATKEGKWYTVDAFGGQLTENVIMRMEQDIVQAAQFRLEEAGYEVILDVYDEILCLVDEGRADQKEFDAILLDVQPWVKQLKVPIAVEGWIGREYRK